MSYFSMKEWGLAGFKKSKVKDKMYAAIIYNKQTKRRRTLNFGSVHYQNFRDVTGLNLYPHLIHGDKKRRDLFHARHKGFIKEGYYSPSFFSYYFLW